MSAKPTILVFNKFYLPGFRAGGPIRTIANLVDRLGEEFDIRIVTQNHDSGGGKVYSCVDLSSWNAVGHSQVRYLPRQTVSLRLMQKLIKEVSPDIIYLNSCFDPLFTRRVLLLRWIGKLDVPVILAPRGEFSAGALGLKAWRKRAYLRFARVVGLYRNLTWQASSEHEKGDILGSFAFIPESSIKIAMNLAPRIAVDGAGVRARNSEKPLRICFFSRISPMKNLDYALRALAHVRSHIQFTIYGPKEVPSYWDECEALIRSLPGNIEVIYSGELKPNDVSHALSAHDLFFLPTRGENYGHVIHEALSAGLPVLISDQTPWNDVRERDVGWNLPLDDMQGFATVIDDVAGWVPAAFESMRRRAAEYAVERAGDEVTLIANRALFMSAYNRESA